MTLVTYAQARKNVLWLAINIRQGLEGPSACLGTVTYMRGLAFPKSAVVA